MILEELFIQRQVGAIEHWFKDTKLEMAEKKRQAPKVSPSSPLCQSS